jgi:hypothetical protein
VSGAVQIQGYRTLRRPSGPRYCAQEDRIRGPGQAARDFKPEAGGVQVGMDCQLQFVFHGVSSPSRSPEANCITPYVTHDTNFPPKFAIVQRAP